MLSHNQTLAAGLTDVLLFEVAPIFSRDKVTLGAGPALPLGTVLAKNAAGEYNPVDFAGTGGAQTAVAVLCEAEPVRAAARQGEVWRGGCVLDRNTLVWPAGATTLQKNTALASLSALSIYTSAAL